MNPVIVNRFTLIVGSFLLVEGLWGLFSPKVLFFMTSNLLLSALLIAIGAAGVWTSLHRGAKTVCFTLGAVLLATGMLRLFDWSSQIIVNLFDLNVAAATIFVLIGTAALMIAIGPTRGTFE